MAEGQGHGRSCRVQRRARGRAVPVRANVVPIRRPLVDSRWRRRFQRPELYRYSWGFHAERRSADGLRIQCSGFWMLCLSAGWCRWVGYGRLVLVRDDRWNKRGGVCRCLLWHRGTGFRRISDCASKPICWSDHTGNVRNLRAFIHDARRQHGAERGFNVYGEMVYVQHGR